MLKKIIGTAFFIFIIFLFCYFRLKPLYFQSVGYTYDQGRDFLKAAEIIRDKNITFIGPTTGVQGLFHGVWYYYLLTIPFVLFGGSPIGFYYFNFFLQLAGFLVLIYFLQKYLGNILAALAGLLIATSPYFIFISLFVGNNIMVIPTLLLFLIAHFYLLETKPDKPNQSVFLIGLLIGMIAEFEVAFGLFIMPAYFLTILFNSPLRKFFGLKNNLFGFFTGLIIPFSPRLIFELKNNFMQTKVLITKLSQTSTEHPNTYTGALKDRLDLFFDYFSSLFANEYLLLMFTVAIFLISVTLLTQNIRKYKAFFIFLISQAGFLFLLSTLYKDSFFWGNYFEGIQYLIVLLVIILLYFGLNSNSLLAKLLVYSLLISTLIYNLQSLVKVDSKKSDSTGTLNIASQVVNYIDSSKKAGENFCVKVYTPPVIPYTYDYLFLYSSLTKKTPYPDKNWVNRQCWFIVESDDNAERRSEWLEKNLPRRFSVSNKKTFTNIEVGLYSL